MQSSDAEISITLEEGKSGIRMQATKRRFIMSGSFLSSYFEGHVRTFHDVMDTAEGKS